LQYRLVCHKKLRDIFARQILDKNPVSAVEQFPTKRKRHEETMYNSRTNNARQNLTEADSTDDPADDIDVLLQADPASAETPSFNAAAVDALDEPSVELDAADPCTHLAALRLRTRHITDSLNTALESVCELQDLADQDRLSSGRFIAEMHHWDRVMGQLERYTQGLPASSANELDAADNEESPRVDELLDALKSQEDKIDALESRLNANAAAASRPRVNRLLVISMGDKNLKFPITSAIVTLGRGKKNDIQLHSSHASRNHARILSDDHGAYVEDLKSANGVMVNSKKIIRQKLCSGDIIVAGRIQIKFIDLMEVSSGEGEA